VEPSANGEVWPNNSKQQQQQQSINQATRHLPLSFLLKLNIDWDLRSLAISPFIGSMGTKHPESSTTAFSPSLLFFVAISKVGLCSKFKRGACRTASKLCRWVLFEVCEEGDNRSWCVDEIVAICMFKISLSIC
tara:strand:- start:41 stop:442 length:402 start_codon:yes stop_codon:yes gene_type:complete